MKHTLLFSLFALLSGSLTMLAMEQPAISQNVDSIVVIKHSRVMEVYSHDQLIRTFHVCLGPTSVGAKRFRNDGKTPEGFYHINDKNPYSHYHKCLGISYPSSDDASYAAHAGKPAGGDIKIHGLPNGQGHLAREYVKQDWTLGCMALTDDEIDELYAHTNIGTPIRIVP